MRVFSRYLIVIYAYIRFLHLEKTTLNFNNPMEIKVQQIIEIKKIQYNSFKKIITNYI